VVDIADDVDMLYASMYVCHSVIGSVDIMCSTCRVSSTRYCLNCVPLSFASTINSLYQHRHTTHTYNNTLTLTYC
jgi:hypothetical protein